MWYNLYDETVLTIEGSGHTIDDIDWVGCVDFTINTKKFLAAAKNFNYDAGYGTAYVPTDLIVHFKDGSYLERNEYDGSEWWHYVHPIAKPSKHINSTVTFAEESGWGNALLNSCVEDK